MPPAVTYRLKVTLAGVKPPVWRRFETPADVTLLQLHQILQIVMGWTDSHLHQFDQDGVLYGPADPEFGLERVSEKTTRLRDVLASPKDHIDYEYDFGDSWSHRIVLEKIVEADIRRRPRVLDAKRACPPEDVGGAGGYEMFLEAMARPDHKEHEEYREWYRGQFDPDAYDVQRVNAALAGLRLGPASSRSAKGGQRLRRDIRAAKPWD